MNTFDPERRKAEEKAAKEARMQYVEELAGPDVYPDGGMANIVTKLCIREALF